MRTIRARGFTLIEILLVLALSFIGLFGMMTVLVVAQRAAMNARAVTEATALAQDKVEQLVHLPQASIAGATESGLGPQGSAVSGGAYTRTTTVTPAGSLTTIRVQVAWNDLYQNTHSVNLWTVRGP